MAWYAVYRIADGALVSVGTRIDPESLDPSLGFTALPDQPDMAAETWDGATRTFVTRPVTKDDIEQAKLGPYYEAWKRWKDTLAEAQTRGLPSAVITALTAKVNAEWTQYVAAVEDWRNA